MRNKTILLVSIASFIFCFASATRAQWVKVSDGLPTNITIGSLITLGSDLFAGDPDRDSGIYRWDNKSGKWNQVDTGLPFSESGGDRYVLALDTLGQNLYIGTKAGIFLSSDRGDHWNSISSYPQIRLVSSIAHKGSTLFIAAGEGTSAIYRSPDNGANWISVNDSDFPVQPYIRTLCVSGSNLLAGIDQAGIYLSTDSGSHWTKCNPSGVKNATFADVIRVPMGIVTSGYGGQVYLSIDDGASWSTFFSPPTGWNQFLVMTNGLIFAGIESSGVSISTNGGVNWLAANTGLENATIMALAASGGFLYAGTYYGSGSNQSDQGVWRRPLSDFANAGVAQETSATIELSPNPTSGMLIVHGTSAESQVTLMNLLGQSVLDVAQHTPDFTLDLSRLAPGAYCIRLASPGKNVTKMIVRE